MTDFFREVDEELRRDRMANVWARYNAVIIGVAVLVVLATAGWRYWTYRAEQQAGAAGARFEEALRLARDGKDAEAVKGFDALATDATGGYRVLARLRAASEIAKSDAQAGAAAFEKIATDGAVDPLFRDLARIREAMLLIDKADRKEIVAKVEGLAVPANAWRNSARELLGLAALKAGDYESAGRWFDQIVVDPAAPSGLRQRTEVYLGIVRAGPATTSTQ